MIDTLLIALDNRLERITYPRRQWPVAILLLLPSFVILSLFHFLPLLYAIALSFTGGRHGRGGWVGAGNYVEAARGSAFWNSTLVTGYYAAGVVPLGILLSLCIALGLHRLPRGQSILRAAFFLPYVTSIAAAAMVWRALYNGQGGLFNAVLQRAGFPAQQWLLEPRGVLHILTGGQVDPDVGPSLALCCIMLFDIWHGSGFMVVILLTGLSAIPREFEEGAQLDGASALQTARHITIPLLSSTLLFLATIGIAGAFQAFTSFFALSPGGGNALGTTENLMLHLYANFYEYGYWGYGCAVAVIISVLISFLALLQWRLARSRVFYQ